MTDNTSIKNLLQIAAPYAIYKWAESEKYSVEEIQSYSRIDENVLSGWLRKWGLSQALIKHRPSPKTTSMQEIHERLANSLCEIRPLLLGSRKKDIPHIVEKSVKKLQDDGVTIARQTSLISKFAFSLRPDITAPYDSYARGGLKVYYGRKIDDHDYLVYFKKFNQFANECSKELDETLLTTILQPLWGPLMNKTVFKHRTADKLLMILGGLLPTDNLESWGISSQ